MVYPLSLTKPQIPPAVSPLTVADSSSKSRTGSMSIARSVEGSTTRNCQVDVGEWKKVWMRGEEGVLGDGRWVLNGWAGEIWVNLGIKQLLSLEALINLLKQRKPRTKTNKQTNKG